MSSVSSLYQKKKTNPLLFCFILDHSIKNLMDKKKNSNSNVFFVSFWRNAFTHAEEML